MELATKVTSCFPLLKSPDAGEVSKSTYSCIDGHNNRIQIPRRYEALEVDKGQPEDNINIWEGKTH